MARERAVDAGRLWAAGAATAVVAGLVGLVGVLVSTTVFDVNPVVPGWLLGDGTDADRSIRFAVTAAVAALLATGLLHLLLLWTPRPRMFFGWIVTLVTIAAAVVPFASDAPAERQLATSLLALCIGLVVGILLSGAVRAASPEA